MKKQKIKITNDLFKVLAVIIIFLTVASGIFCGLFMIERAKTIYYREQMINFCEFVDSQTKLLELKYPYANFPDVTPCERWRLSYD